MSVCLLTIGDGRHVYHARSLASALEHLPKFDQYVFVDDPAHELGFAGAIQEGWGQVATDYVCHLELDFIFHGSVPVERMVALLERRPYLAQVALKRQAWNEQERAAGGIVEFRPGDFEEHADGREVWTEHRCFFTTNPSVYPARLCEPFWPQVAESEGVFTHQLLEDPDLRFAFWGGKFDEPLVDHIGAERVGVGY